MNVPLLQKGLLDKCKIHSCSDSQMCQLRNGAAGYV